MLIIEKNLKSKKSYNKGDLQIQIGPILTSNLTKYLWLDIILQKQELESDVKSLSSSLFKRDQSKILLSTLVICSCIYWTTIAFMFYFAYCPLFCICFSCLILTCLILENIFFNYANIPLFKLHLWLWVDYINNNSFPKPNLPF